MNDTSDQTSGVYDATDTTAMPNVMDPVEASDIVDADVFESLNQTATVSAVSIPEDVKPAESQEDPQPPEDPVNSEPTSELVIKHFSLGRPGALIDGMDQGPSIYMAHRLMFGDLKWAPFRSECDWDVAWWAKMQGPSSSAITKLFAIPGVCAMTDPFLLISLTCNQRLLRHLAFPIGQQTS